MIDRIVCKFQVPMLLLVLILHTFCSLMNFFKHYHHQQAGMASGSKSTGPAKYDAAAAKVCLYICIYIYVNMYI
jgi:hypothetical protein